MKKFIVLAAILIAGMVGYSFAFPPVPPSTPPSDEAYGAGWNGITTVAPSKNAVYDKIATLGVGDVTGVGDCADGACLDGSSDGGTYIRLYDGNSHYTGFTAGDSIANLTFKFPTAYPAGTHYLTSTDAGVLGTADPALKANVASPTFTGIVTSPTFTASGAVTKSPLAATGAQVNVVAATITDAFTPGTRAVGAASAFGIPTFASDGNAITVTNAATVYIAGVPVDGGANMDLTNVWALYVGAGGSYFPSITSGSFTDGTATLTGGALTGLTTPLTAAQGGAGADTSGMTGTPYVTAGVVSVGTQTKSIILNEPTASDDFLIWRTPYAITITAIHGVLLTGTNVVGGIDECDSNGANCVAVDDDITFDGSLDSDDGSLTNASIDAGDWVRWHTTSVSAPGYLTVTIYFQ